MFTVPTLTGSDKDKGKDKDKGERPEKALLDKLKLALPDYDKERDALPGTATNGFDCHS